MTTPATDTVIWPVLEALRTAVATQLGDAGRPVCVFPVYLADHPLPADGCDCTCPDGGQGVGWVRLITATTLTPGGTTRAASQAGCTGSQLQLTLEIGVQRCAPILDPEQQPLLLPYDDYTAHSAGISQDLTALHRALLCSSPWLRDTTWHMTQLAPLGPRGGCAGALAHVQVVRDNCCPLQLAVSWAPDPDTMLAARITVGGIGEYGASIDFGDGTPALQIGQPGTVTHTYQAAGTYTVRVADLEAPGITATVTVTVTGAAPAAVAFLAADDPWAVLLWLDEPAGVEFLVDWGDLGTPQTLSGQADDPQQPRARHLYPRSGAWTITVTNPASRRVSTVVVDTGEIGIRVIPNEDDDGTPQIQTGVLAAGATCRIQVGNAPAAPITVPASGWVNHSPPVALPAGEHTVTVAEVVAGVVRRQTRRTLLVPPDADPRLEVELTWGPSQLEPPAGEPEAQLLHLTALGARADCVVDWGDGAPDTVLAQWGSADHEYQPPLGGWLLRVTEVADALADGQTPRVFTRLLGGPRYVGPPVLSSHADGAVDLTVAGADDRHGWDWYRIDWGDGADPDEHAAGGPWWTAQHTYPAPGSYVITLDGPGMGTPVTRAVNVRRYTTEPDTGPLFPGPQLFPSTSLYPRGE